MDLLKLVIVLVGAVLLTGCVSNPSTNTQWTDDAHGTIVEKRVDTWGNVIKNSDYVLVMNNSGMYYETVVSFKRYASVNVGDKI